MRSYAAGLLLVLIACPALAGEKPGEPEKPSPDEIARERLEAFGDAYRTRKWQDRVTAVRKLTPCVHESVTKRLVQVLAKDPERDVQLAVIAGLRKHEKHAKIVLRAVAPILEDDKRTPQVLEALVQLVVILDGRRHWREIARLIGHEDDELVVACFRALGKWKELGAHREILTFWKAYPEEGKWIGLKSKLVRGRSRWPDRRGWNRGRPTCVRALKRAVEEMTGEEIETHTAFQEWCKKNRAKIANARRRRN